MPVADFARKVTTMKASPNHDSVPKPSPKRSSKCKSRSSSGKLKLGGNSAEIKSYLSKLQDLVPFVPKDRKLSKLEVIQGVIDYICHLQGALQTHPAVVAAAAAAVSAEATSNAMRTCVADDDDVVDRPYAVAMDSSDDFEHRQMSDETSEQSELDTSSSPSIVRV